MDVFFFFFSSPMTAFWFSESGDPLDVDRSLCSFGVLALTAFLFAASGLAYFTFTSIFPRSSSGDGRLRQGSLGIGTSMPFQLFSMISTMISCCSDEQCTSKLTITGRSEDTNAESRIAAQTSRNETSLVSVYPCKTLGSARVVVENDCQGVGKASVSPSGVLSLEEEGDLERMERPCE